MFDEITFIALEDDGPCQLSSITHGVDGPTNQPTNFSNILLEIFRELHKIAKEWDSAYSPPKVFKFDKKKLLLFIERASKTYEIISYFHNFFISNNFFNFPQSLHNSTKDY